MSSLAVFEGLSGPADLRVWAPKEWAVIRDISFEGQVVPFGFISDLASIPKPLRAVYDTDDEIRIPALFHDWWYCSQLFSREEADRRFLGMMKAAGVGLAKRNSVYAGVRIGGWYRYNQRKHGPSREDFAWPILTQSQQKAVEAVWPSVLLA